MSANRRLPSHHPDSSQPPASHNLGVSVVQKARIRRRGYDRAMPELPEVETIRRDLEPLLVGRRIVEVEVDPGTIQLLAKAPIEALRSTLVGRTFASMGRRGKYILLGMDDGRTLIIHLRMTGRLLWRESSAPVEQWERAKLVLDDGHDLRWADLRKFGTWSVADDTAALFARLGPEPIDKDLTLKAFRGAIAGRTAPVKAVLLDQRRMAGLGNIYVDEALYEARIRPDTPAANLSPAATRRLFASTRAVLERGIENRGASFKDYVDGQGQPGSQHLHVQVFRRTGKPCYACATLIVRTVVGGRSTHFCPKCQPKGRVPRKASRAG